MNTQRRLRIRSERRLDIGHEIEVTMESQAKHWLPLTEYALRSGMSISTLRRKIKSNAISYKMEDGRYLIQSDDLFEAPRVSGFSSSDEPRRHSIPTTRPSAPEKESPAPAVFQTPAPAPVAVPFAAEVDTLRAELRRARDEDILRWKALEARVAGLAKKLEFFSEQMAETKMLVKIFEEKMDSRAQ